MRDPEALKNLDVERLRAFFDIQREARADRAQAEFTEAMIAVKSELRPVIKKHDNHEANSSSFAKLEDIEKELDEKLVKHGFSTSISEEPHNKGNAELARFVMSVRHVGGHTEKHYLESPLDYLGKRGNPAKTKVHGLFSSYTQAVKYLKCNVFGINLKGKHDDDGNAAGGFQEAMTAWRDHRGAKVKEQLKICGPLVENAVGDDQATYFFPFRKSCRWTQLSKIPLTHRRIFSPHWKTLRQRRSAMTIIIRAEQFKIKDIMLP